MSSIGRIVQAMALDGLGGALLLVASVHFVQAVQKRRVPFPGGLPLGQSAPEDPQQNPVGRCVTCGLS